MYTDTGQKANRATMPARLPHPLRRDILPAAQLVRLQERPWHWTRPHVLVRSCPCCRARLSEMVMKCLIVNADDFGLSDGVNQAIMLGHRQGIITSATLMANGAGFASAV